MAKKLSVFTSVSTVPHHLIASLGAIATAATWAAKNDSQAVAEGGANPEWQAADISEAAHDSS